MTFLLCHGCTGSKLALTSWARREKSLAGFHLRTEHSNCCTHARSSRSLALFSVDLCYTALLRGGRLVNVAKSPAERHQRPQARATCSSWIPRLIRSPKRAGDTSLASAVTGLYGCFDRAKVEGSVGGFLTVRVFVFLMHLSWAVTLVWQFRCRSGFDSDHSVQYHQRTE